MYRPQFPFPAPPSPCEDQTCLYSFDATNLPVFTGSLAAGQQTGRVPLRLDKDADFYLRAFDTQGGVSIRFEDTEGNALSDSENSIQSSNFEFPKNYGQTAGAAFVPLESGAGGVFAPAGGNFLVYLFNGTGATLNLTTCAINLVGVKRYTGEACAA